MKLFEKIGKEIDKLEDGKEVDLDIASLIFKGRNGFMRHNKEGEGVAFSISGKGLVIDFLKIENGKAKIVESRGLGVDDEIKNKLIFMAKMVCGEFEGYSPSEGIKYIG